MCVSRYHCPVSAIAWSNNMKFLRMNWRSTVLKEPPIWPFLGIAVSFRFCFKFKIVRNDSLFSYRSTVGVVCHYWYKFLDKRMPGRSLTIVLKKVFWDQMICSPIVISTFFLTLGLLEQSSKEEIVAEIKSKAWKLYAGKAIPLCHWHCSECFRKKMFCFQLQLSGWYGRQRK